MRRQLYFISRHFILISFLMVLSYAYSADPALKFDEFLANFESIKLPFTINGSKVISRYHERLSDFKGRIDAVTSNKFFGTNYDLERDYWDEGHFYKYKYDLKDYTLLIVEHCVIAGCGIKFINEIEIYVFRNETLIDNAILGSYSMAFSMGIGYRSIESVIEILEDEIAVKEVYKESDFDEIPKFEEINKYIFKIDDNGKITKHSIK
mgnify:CR=1 FL=1